MLHISRKAEAPPRSMELKLLATIDFAPLLQLTRLYSFGYFFESFSCGAEQVAVLSRCITIVRLFCGSWSPSLEDPRSAERQIEQGIATLVRGRLEALQSVAPVTSASAPTALPLRFLSLRTDPHDCGRIRSCPTTGDASSTASEFMVKRCDHPAIMARPARDEATSACDHSATPPRAKASPRH